MHAAHVDRGRQVEEAAHRRLDRHGHRRRPEDFSLPPPVGTGRHPGHAEERPGPTPLAGDYPVALCLDGGRGAVMEFRSTRQFAPIGPSVADDRFSLRPRSVIQALSDLGRVASLACLLDRGARGGGVRLLLRVRMGMRSRHSNDLSASTSGAG